MLLEHSANDADGIHGVGPVHRLDEGLVMPLDPAGAKVAYFGINIMKVLYLER